jgi:hypothetical protein
LLALSIPGAVFPRPAGRRREHADLTCAIRPRRTAQMR